MRVRKIIKLNPYYMNLYVEFTDDISGRIEKLTEFEVSGGGLACTTNYAGDGYDYIILLSPFADAGIISHEAVHVTNMLFRDKGIKYRYDNDEPFAYMVGWIVEQITKLKERAIDNIPD